jgi:hypothetical protein
MISVNDLVNLGCAINNYHGPDDTFQWETADGVIEATKTVERSFETWMIGEVLILQRPAYAPKEVA